MPVGIQQHRSQHRLAIGSTWGESAGQGQEPGAPGTDIYIYGNNTLGEYVIFQP